jgi:phosphoribosylformylglycinamidine synthase subunit PurSL
MDLKEAGNRLYVVGVTREELAGSYIGHALGLEGGSIPKVDASLAWRIYTALHRAIKAGQVVSCHDLSEGGLAVALSEMAFAGELGVDVDLTKMREACFVSPEMALFSESNSRLICEVPESQASAFEQSMPGLPCYSIGRVSADDRIKMQSDGRYLVDETWRALRDVWLSPLDWH